MEIRKLMEKVAAGFVRTRGGMRGCDCFDAAVAEVALLIAAIDGTVLPEEFATYRWILGRCPDVGETEGRKLLDAVVQRAGRILLMAQVGAYSEDERLSAFCEMVKDVLPGGFSGCSRTDVRRSFVLWMSMALSDGEFSNIERTALALLRESLTGADRFESGFFEMAEQLLRQLGDPLRRADAEADLDRLVVFADARG